MGKRRQMQGGTPARGGQKPAGLTPARVTPRCACCKRKFTPKRTDARYCSAACRQRAYRRRQRARRRGLSSPPAARVNLCQHCGAGFWATAPGQRYCSPSCRQLAYRARRRQVEAALVAAGVPAGLAADTVERFGLARVRAALAAGGDGRGHTTRIDV